MSSYGFQWLPMTHKAPFGSPLAPFESVWLLMAITAQICIVFPGSLQRNQPEVYEGIDDQYYV